MDLVWTIFTRKSSFSRLSLFFESLLLRLLLLQPLEERERERARKCTEIIEESYRERECRSEIVCKKMDTPQKTVTQIGTPISRLKLEVFLQYPCPVFVKVPCFFRCSSVPVSAMDFFILLFGKIVWFFSSVCTIPIAQLVALESKFQFFSPFLFSIHEIEMFDNVNTVSRV